MNFEEQFPELVNNAVRIEIKGTPEFNETEVTFPLGIIQNNCLSKQRVKETFNMIIKGFKERQESSNYDKSLIQALINEVQHEIAELGLEREE